MPGATLMKVRDTEGKPPLLEFIRARRRNDLKLEDAFQLAFNLPRSHKSSFHNLRQILGKHQTTFLVNTKGTATFNSESTHAFVIWSTISRRWGSWMRVMFPCAAR